MDAQIEVIARKDGDGVSADGYRMIGGPADGRYFATLIELYEFAREHDLRLAIGGT